jgi:hypothetical protein
MDKKFVTLLFLILLFSVSPSQNIVINEIMYNPCEPGTDTTEYVELYNSCDIAIDISDWAFVNAFDYLFPAATSIDSGGYLLVVKDSIAMKNFYNISDTLHQWNGTLLNSGEEIILLNAAGDTADYVAYDNGGIWPNEANGTGPSLELLSAALDNSEGNNWRSSDTANAPFGTPGKENSVFPGTNIPPEITSEPLATAFVGTVYQYQVVAIDADNDPLTFYVNSSATFLCIDTLTGLISGIAGTGDKGIYPVEIIASDSKNGFDSQHYDLVVLEPQTISKIVINEIMYNPEEAGSDTTEYIELINSGSEIVDIGRWSFGKGLMYTFPIPTLLNPDDFLVVTVDSNALKNTYGEIDLLHQWKSGALANSGEDIVLVNAAGAMVDSVTYGTGGDWPSEPNGHGPSLELIDPALDNDLARNWKSSDTGIAQKGTPGTVNSVFVQRTDHTIFINEFMIDNKNTIEDSTDKNFDPWIELYYGGQSDIHLSGYYITKDPENPVQCLLSDTIMGKGSFLIIWCDNDMADPGVHANFHLNENDRFLGLYFVTGTDTIAIDTLTFPLQSTDISYGRNPDGGEEFSFYSTPTPGFSNNEGNILSVSPEPSMSVKNFILYQNYPNPFNLKTKISLHFPFTTKAALAVYNILGQKVALLLDEKIKAGQRTIYWDAGGFPSGIYYYTLKTAEFQETRKMILLK